MKDRKNNPNLPAKNVVSIIIAFLVFVVVVGGIILATSILGKRGSSAGGGSTRIFFNEIMSSNSATYYDISAGLCDWIELYNDSDDVVDISGYTISSSASNITYTLPSSAEIPAKGFFVVCCSDKASSTYCAPFTIKKSGGETLVLKNRDSTTTDTVKTVGLESDTVMSRQTYGADDWTVLDYGTPMFANTEDGLSNLSQSRYALQSNIIINEYMPINHLGLTDKDGAYSDWIEIKNCSSESVNLKNYSLSNSLETPYMWQFPDITLSAGEIITVFASGKDISKAGHELHSNFKLNAVKSDVVLCDKNGKIIDASSYIEAAANASYERGDGTYSNQTFSPTPNFDNDEAGYEKAYAEINKTRTELVIYEAMSKNTSYIKQNGANYYDWVTVKNISNHTIDLANYFMTNDAEELSMWQMPNISLNAGDTITFIASGSEVLSNSSYKHTNFKINNDEEVFITNGNSVIDGACLKGTPIDYSYGRIDGKNGFYYFESPTPNSDNGTGIWAAASTPIIRTASGVFNSAGSVTVLISGEGDIYYSTDGTTPTRTSGKKYTQAITLTETANIRVVSYSDTKLRSSVASATYVINENHTLPVMTLSVDYDDMFSAERGINAYGYSYNNYIPYEGANFWKDWEREAYAEFFDIDGTGFATGCGIKIFGAYSRYLDKKSFLLKFRDMYGNGDLEYNLFESVPDVSSFESIVLRSGSQDWIHTLFRDEWLTSLMQENSDYMYTQAYEPCILYINGEYWGIYFFREKVSDDYVSKHLNVDKDSVNLLEANYRVVSGSNKEYLDLLDYVQTHSMKNEENYKYVLSKIDYMNYIDYFIAEIYSGNQDTGNIKFFKSTDEDSDGLWRWIYFDLDWAFYYNTSIHFYLRAEGKPGFPYITTIMNRLLNNDDFRDMFLSRFAHHLKTTFSPEIANAKIDELFNQLSPEMARECARWNKTLNRWENEVSSLKAKVINKRQVLLNDLKSEFSLSNAEYEKYFGDVL